jgi:hypothetical protein
VLAAILHSWGESFGMGVGIKANSSRFGVFGPAVAHEELAVVTKRLSFFRELDSYDL